MLDDGIELALDETLLKPEKVKSEEKEGETDVERVAGRVVPTAVDEEDTERYEADVEKEASVLEDDVSVNVAKGLTVPEGE
jgi:hypothetical protein